MITTTSGKPHGDQGSARFEPSIIGRMTKCTEAATVANDGDGQASKTHTNFNHAASSVFMGSKKSIRYQQPAHTLTEISEAIRAGDYQEGRGQRVRTSQMM